MFTLRKLHLSIAMAIGGNYGLPQINHVSHTARRLAEHSIATLNKQEQQPE